MSGNEDAPLRAAERRPAAFLALAFMMLAFALVAARAARDALFLATRGAAALPTVYAASALAIALGVFLTSRLARRIRSEVLYALASAAFGALLLCARLAMGVTALDALVAPLYVAVEAGSAVLLVLLWRLVEGAFREPRTAARLQARCENALLGLLILGGVWALVLLAAIEARELLLFAAGFAWCSSAAAVVLLARGANGPVARGSALAGAIALGGAADLRLAAAAAGLGAFLAGLVDWQLKDVIAARFPGDANWLARIGAAVFIASAVVALAARQAALLVRHRLGVTAAMSLALGVAITGQLFLLLASVTWAAVIARAPFETLRPSTLDGTLERVLRPAPRRLRDHWSALVEELLRPGGLALAALALMVLADPHEVVVATLLAAAGLHLVLRRLRHEHARGMARSRRRWPEPGLVLKRVLGDAQAGWTVESALMRDDPAVVVDALEVAPLVEADLGRVVALLVAHPEPRVRRLACEYFARRPRAERSDVVQRGLKDADVAARASALRAWCTVAGERALESALPFFEDEAPALVAAAAVGVSCIGREQQRARAAVTRLARQESSEARRLAAEAARDIADPGLASVVRRLLEDDDIAVRRAAIEAAGALRDPELLRPLLWALGVHETTRVTEAALARFDAAPLAAALEQHADPQVAAGILRALGRVGSAEALQALTESLWSERAYVRGAAARALAGAVHDDPAAPIQRAKLRAACMLELGAAYRVLAAIEALYLPREPRPGTSGLPRPEGGPPPADPIARAASLMAWALDEEHERATERVFLVLAALHPDAVSGTPEPGRRVAVIEALANQLEPALARGLLRLFSGLPREEVLRGAAGILAPPVRTAEEWIVELLGAEDAWTVTAAVTWAGAHELEAAIPRVLWLLESPRGVVREAALETLELLMPIEQLPRVVRPLLWDEVSAVRERVDRILGRIVDEAELRQASGTVERVFAC